MFTKPIDEITFEDVESFCEERGEGVRVEYKRDINVKKHIPKIVSSFANTHGGIFIIGVETEKETNKVVFPIEGIPKRPGIEEQIQQSAEMVINPPVRPDVKIVEVPNSENVVVVIRVAEGSLLAPHAIEDSTKTYFRVGSITQPYKLELANMNLIAHMFKRREDSQVVARQIFNRIETRAGRRFRPGPDKPDLTIIAKPVLPYRPLISALDIYELCARKLYPLRRVEGGVACFDGSKYSEYITKEYIEFNEYGIVYRRGVLSISDQSYVDCDQFFLHIKGLIGHTIDFYRQCEYLGDIKISIQLQEVLGKVLIDSRGDRYREDITGDLDAETECFDTEVFASKQCFARDLENEETRKDIVEDLMYQLLWAFNIPIDNKYVKMKVRKRIEREFS